MPVIAAFHAVPDPAAGLPFSWSRVARVVYRNLPGGQVIPVYAASPGRLLNVIASVARGMRQQVVVPRLLSGGADCRDCAYRDACFGDGGWDVLDVEAVTTTARAGQLSVLIREVRSAVGDDDRAAARASEALAAVERALEDAPDAGEVVAEAASALRTSAGQA